MEINERMRIGDFNPIHHSDRGIQYCSASYVEMLMDDEIAISMRQSGSPYENALAERVNGIIKNDFSPKIIYQNHSQAKGALQKTIKVYNEKRPHLSINYMTPAQAHLHHGPIDKCWKQYRKKNKKKEVSMN